MKILVVDDNTQIRELCRQVLTSLGHDCDIAISGDEVLKLIKDHHYELLITDIQMPGMDGWTLARKVRAINKAIGIMVISGYWDSAHGDLNFPVVVVQKPFSMGTLQQGIETTMQYMRGDY